MEAYCKAAAEVIRIVRQNTAIERVSGESLNDLLIAPDWAGNRTEIWKGILAAL
jgi:radical SAM superfamily enzyme